MFTRKTLAMGALAAVFAGGLSTVAACSGGSSAPPTASSVLSGDGYSVLDNVPASQIGSTFGAAGPDVLSAAAGTNSSGSAEVVVVFNTAGASLMNADKSQLQTALSGGGATYSLNGQVLKVDGSLSALGSLGS
jgi:hypothetical protein